MLIALLAERHNSLGRHIFALADPEANTREFLKILYIFEVGYYTSGSAVKITILSFYRRIFPVQELKLLLFVAVSVVLFYFIGSICVTLFQW